MSDDQLLQHYAEAVEHRDEVLAVLLSPDTSLDDRRDAAITYSLLSEVAETLERRAGFVRISVDSLRRIDRRIEALIDAIVGPQVGAEAGSRYRYLDEDLVIAPRGSALRTLTERTWAEFFDGVVLEIRAYIEGAS